MTSPAAPPNRSVRSQVFALAVWVVAIAFCVALVARSRTGDGGSLLRYGSRIALVVFSLLAWFRTQALIGGRALQDGAITDVLHALSAPLHARLEHNPRAANAILIASSAGIDAFGVFLILWSIFGPSMRPFATLLILFAMRQGCQALCALPAPPGMIWRHPGVPSLLVTYDVGNDFFFSGHTAIAVIGAIELARIAPWLGVAGAVVALVEAAVVIVLRAHYTMDVFTAAVAAGVAAGLSAWIFTLL